jgi:hypothetical protein
MKLQPDNLSALLLIAVAVVVGFLVMWAAIFWMMGWAFNGTINR